MRCAILALALLSVALALSTGPLGYLEELSGGYKPCDPVVPQWSGYFSLTSGKHYFYWAFGPRSGRANAPVLLWMTGGPGCSSSLAMIAENGPCHIYPNGTLYNNTYSWNADAFVVYIDQPAGVGYSYSDSGVTDHNETQVANDMYAFLQALFQAHQDWQANPFFVFGESYGGHFAPATAHRVWLGNQNNEGIHINLQGLAVGNGLTDPVVQYQYYGQLAYNWCQTKLGHPCVSQSTYQGMVKAIPQCLTEIKGCMANKSEDCLGAQSYCNNDEIGPYEQTGLNPYDIRKQCGSQPLCYDFTAATNFFNRKDVQTALGAKATTWQSCNMNVNQGFTADWFQEFSTLIPDLLNSNIRTLIYAGDCDFICNWIGNKEWTLNMTWSGQSKFVNTKDQPWTVSGTSYGMARYVSSAQNPILFTFLQVYSAGHMVPMDQPTAAQQMVFYFTSGKPFY